MLEKGEALFRVFSEQDILSRFFGYGQRHMTRILKSYTNEGFQQNLQHIRMQFALKYLGEGNRLS